MANDPNIKACLEETISFLEAFKPNAPWHLVAINEASQVTAKTFSLAQREGVLAWVKDVGTKANLYFHVATLKNGVKHRKARKQDVLESPMLHVDIDSEDALDRLRTFSPVPTAVVWSGNGAHAYWMLSDPISPERAEKLNLSLATRLKADHCHNADRIMRLPGTLNRPGAQKRKRGCAVQLAYIVDDMTDYSRRYEPDDFSGQEIVGLHQNSGPILEDRSTSQDLDSMRVNDYVKNLIQIGDHPYRPIGSADAAYPSRSEVVFRVACELVRCKCPEETIVQVLTNPDFGISGSILEKKKAREYAQRQARSAARAVSGEWPDLSRSGMPRSTYRNTVLALQRMELVFAYDEFHRTKSVNGHQIQDLIGELTDDVCFRLRDIIIEAYDFDPGKDHVRDAATSLCIQNTHHPVRDYLKGLSWDGVPRLDQWLSDYLGAEKTPLNAAIGPIILIAAVRRVRQPGTKFDTIAVLEGQQGTGKSQALALLAGHGNFSDQDILALDQKSQMEAMVGVWLFELGELEGLSRADTTKVKAFASRSADKARPAYGRFTETWPRQCIFIGTTNDDRYLRDVTGNRRFWPIRTGEIDLNQLAFDRDQLWAEAAVREAKGESIVLPQHLWTDAAQQQALRLEDDPWLDLLSEVSGERGEEHERIASKSLLSILGFDGRQIHNHHAKRLAVVMRQLKWAGPKPVKIDGKLHRGYERPLIRNATRGPKSPDEPEY